MVMKIGVITIIICSFFLVNKGFSQTSSSKEIRRYLKVILGSSENKQYWKQKTKKVQLDDVKVEFDTTSLTNENTIVFLIKSKDRNTELFFVFDKECGCLFLGFEYNNVISEMLSKKIGICDDI